MIQIFAGKTARATLQQQGFKPELFATFLGASGGPKWFTLFGLDQYLFGEFFKKHHQLDLVGSSAGAFRSACLAQNNPVKAIENLAYDYAGTTYSDNATATEISEKAQGLLQRVLPANAVFQVLQNPTKKAHFIVAKCKGLTAFENKFLQGVGLLSSMVLNRINRKLLQFQYQRMIYQVAGGQFSFANQQDFNTEYIQLSAENFHQALLASGSIPMVMQGVPNIVGSQAGMYRDGGIIDYHFDLKIKSERLVLYPHFNQAPKAGWFDKSIARPVSANHYDNIVLICPSVEFVQALPFQKIPDRTDFTAMPAEQRIQYWHTVLTESKKLADALDKLIHQFVPEQIQPLNADNFN